MESFWMDKEMLRTYTARITQANKSELVTIVFDIIIYNLETAEKAYVEKDDDLFESALKQAQKFINELISTLDFEQVISFDLMQLYLYVNKRVVSALIKKDPETIPSAIKVMKELLVGFEGVAKEDQSSPVMENTQQLYAGLTYGKGTLNEIYMNPNEHNRGFKA